MSAVPDPMPDHSQEVEVRELLARTRELLDALRAERNNPLYVTHQQFADHTQHDMAAHRNVDERTAAIRAEQERQSVAIEHNRQVLDKVERFVDAELKTRESRAGFWRDVAKGVATRSGIALLLFLGALLALGFYSWLTGGQIKVPSVGKPSP